MIDRTVIRSETPWNARLDGARPADDQVDVHPRVRGAVEGLDDGDVHDGVELQHDPGRMTGRRMADLPVDEVQEPAAQAVRSHQQSPECCADGTAR